MKDTESICATCLKTIPATVEFEDGVWLNKNCLACGEERVLIEKSEALYKHFHTAYVPRYNRIAHATCIIPITNKCNMLCPNCYENLGDGSTDPSIEEIVKLCKQAHTDSVILMGAEPTMREDLPQIIKEIKTKTRKQVYMYTNGLKLYNEDYCKELRKSGLSILTISLHTINCLAPSKIGFYENKLIAINNITRNGIIIEHISFTINFIDDLDEILEVMDKLWDKCQHFRIRIPGDIGMSTEGRNIWLSELYLAIKTKARSFEDLQADNNAYHRMMKVNGHTVRLIRWPNIHTIDLQELEMYPTCIFNKEVGEVNFALGAILKSALYKKNEKLS